MKNKLKIIKIVSVLILLMTLILQISVGTYDMKLYDIFQGIFNNELLFNSSYVFRQIFGDYISDFLNIPKIDYSSISNNALIIWNVRMPRFITGILVAINLSISGIIFQTLTKNEMASPYILGISQGSGLSIVLILMLFPSMTMLIPIFSMIGGLLAFGLIYLIAWKKGGTNSIRLVLAGIIIGSIAGAIQRALFYFVSSSAVIQNAFTWTTGSLIGTSWIHVRMILPSTLLILFLSIIFSKQMNLIALGDNYAKSLGMQVEKWRFILAIIGVLSAGSAVSVGGLIGFVGLITPHIGRTLVGSSHENLIVASSFIGPSILVLSDTLSRVLFSPIQIPVGIVMSVLGGTFFLYLMKKHKKVGYV